MVHRAGTAVDTLEQEILNTEQLIAGLPATQVRDLERSLRNLSPAQRAYIGAALHRLDDDKAVPPRYLQLLEHFFERWSGHSLATKLVLLSRIFRFSARWTGRDLPGDEMPGTLFRLPEVIRRAS